MKWDLPEHLVQVAKEELNESEDTREELLLELRQRLQQLPEEDQPHRMDDSYLIAFLRGTKWRIDVAETKIRNMQKFRKEHPQYCEDHSAEHFVDFYTNGPMRVLDGTDKQGSVINCLTPVKIMALESFDDIVKWNMFTLKEQLSNPHMQVNGQVIIQNFAGFSPLAFMRVRKLMMPNVGKFLKLQQDCMPYRMRGVLIVNAPAYMHVMWALFRLFMKPKLRERMRFLQGDIGKALSEYVDLEVLPPDFGGSLQEPRTAWLDTRIAREQQQQGAAPKQVPAAAPESLAEAGAGSTAPAEEAQPQKQKQEAAAAAVKQVPAADAAAADAGAEAEATAEAGAGAGSTAGGQEASQQQKQKQQHQKKQNKKQKQKQKH